MFLYEFFSCKNRKTLWALILFTALCIYFKLFPSDIDIIKVHGKFGNVNIFKEREENTTTSDEYDRDLTNGEWDWQELVEIGGQDHWLEGTKFYVYSAFLDFYK
jgi:hypothetical protein